MSPACFLFLQRGTQLIIHPSVKLIGTVQLLSFDLYFRLLYATWCNPRKDVSCNAIAHMPGIFKF